MIERALSYIEDYKGRLKGKPRQEIDAVFVLQYIIDELKRIKETPYAKR